MGTLFNTTVRWFLVGTFCLLAAAVPYAAEPASATEKPALLPSRKSFVPLKDLQTLVERDRRGVLLPKAEFEELLKLAEKHARENSVPPSPQVLSHATYAARIVGDQLLITVTAELEQLAAGWQIWKFPLQRVGVEKATVNDQPAIIGRTNDQALTVVTSSVGTHQLKLELSTELVTVGSDRVAGFSLLASATGEFTLEVDAGKRLFADGAELTRPRPIDQAANYQLAVGGKPQIQLRITDRASERGGDALTFATSGYGLVVSPGEVTWHVLTSLQVFGRPIDQLILSVPGHLEIAEVDSTGLEAWEIQDDPSNPARTRLTLTYGQPFEGGRKLSLRGVMSVPAGEAWAVPPLTIENVTSHVGQILVQHPLAIRMQVNETDGLRRSTEAEKPVSDMPEDMVIANSNKRLRFDAWREEFTLRLVTEPKQRELHAGIAAVLDVSAAEIGLQAALTLTPRYAPLFDVDVDLSADWTVVAATTAENQPLTWQLIPQSPGINRVHVNLADPLAADATAVVQLRLRRDMEDWPVEADPVEFALPELVAPQANVVETAFVVRGDSDLELIVSNVVGLDTAALKADWERLRFQSQDTRYSADLQVSRKPARVAVETYGFYRLDPQTSSSSLFASVTVEGGSTRQLLVTLPETTPETVRFEALGATLVEQQPLTADNGHRVWRLQFAERILGRMGLTTRFSMPRTPEDPFQAPLLEIPQAERAHGAVIVEAGPEQRLTITTQDSQGLPLHSMDPLELPPVPYTIQERIVGVYRTIGLGNVLTISEQRYDKAAIPTAICPHLSIRSILSRTGEWQQQSTFELQLAGIQQLLVKLPAAAEFWAATLNDQPVEIRHAGEQLLIPLPRDLSGAAAIQLKLNYRTASQPLSARGQLSEVPPTLAALTGQGTTQEIDILEQTWNLIHPVETLIIDHQSAMEPQTPLDSPSWLSGWSTAFQLPHTSDIVWSTLAICIVSGVLAAFVLIYRRGGAIATVTTALAVGVMGLVLMCVMLAAPLQRESRLKGYATSATPYADAVSTWEFQTPMAPATAPMPAPVNSPMAETEVIRKLADHDGDFDKAMPGEANGRFLAGEKRLPQAPATPEAKSSAAKRENADRRSVAQDERPVLERMEKLAEPMAADDAPVAPAADPFQVEMEFVQPPNEDFAEGMMPARNLSRDSLSRAQGRLSLALVMDQPASSVEKTFRYTGSATLGTGVPLKVQYWDRRGGAAFRGFLLTVGLLLGWILRSQPLVRKLGLVICLILIALGFLPAAPAAWQVFVDGIVFFVMGLLLAWLVYRCGALCDAFSQCCSHLCTRFGLLLLALGLCGSDGIAAEPETKPAVPPLPATQVLLYDDPQAPLAADQVFLPYDQFLKLHRLAHPEWQKLPTAPTTAKIVDALYSAQVMAGGPDASSVVVRARYTILSYVDGQQPLPLPVSGVIIKSAKLNDEPAALVTSAAPWQVLLPKPGLQILDLEFQVPFAPQGTAGSFSLNLAPSPAARFDFQLPDPTLSVRLNGSTSAYRRVNRNNETHIEFPVDAGGELQISWQPEQARDGAAVVHVESVTAVTVADTGVSASIGYQYRIRQGVLRDLSLAIPEGLRLQTVLGPDVGGWELIGEGANRRLRVFLRRNVNDQTQLTLECYLGQRVDPDVSFDAPNVIPLEITTEAGTTAIYASDNFSLRTNNVQRLNQVESQQFQPAVPVTRPEMSPQLAYRFSRRPWQLNLTASRLNTQMQVQIEQGMLISPRKVRITSRAICRLARMPRTSFSLDVPANWLVLDVQAAGLTDWYRLPQDDDRAILQLEFASPQQGEVTMVLTATQSRTPDSTLLDIQPLLFRDVDRAQTQVALWFEEGLSGQVSDPGSWQAIDATTVSPALRNLQPTGAQLAFSNSAQQPGQLELMLHQQRPQLSSSSLTVINVTDVATVYGLVFQWQIQRASTEALVLDLPVWLTPRLQFQGSEIRDVRSTPLDQLFTRWTISLRGPVSGTFRLTASASLPAATALIPAPEIRFVSSDTGVSTPLENQRQYLLLINTSLSQLTSVDPSVTEPIQREDCDLVVRDALLNQATEFVRLTTPGSPPSWTLQRYVPEADIPAAVNLADLITLLAQDGSYRAMATYTIKNRDRQFLPVRLPSNSRLLSVLVGNAPSRAVMTTIGDSPAYLIALPKTSAVDLSFPVQVVYAGALGNPLPSREDLSSQDIDIPTAAVVGQAESSEYGIPVARTQWKVYLPKALIGSPLDNHLRHNMNTSTQGIATESLISVLVSDAQEVLSAVDVASNSRLKYRALNNLKQLDSALEQFSANANQSAETAQTAQRLKATVSQLELDVSQTMQMDGGVMPDGRSVIERGSSATIQGLSKSRDASEQLNLALGNNSYVFSDNGNPTQTRSRTEQDFRFRYAQPEAAAKPTADDVKSLAEEAAKKGNTLEARQIYQKLNEDQLSNLNSTIVSGKQQRSRVSGSDYFQNSNVDGVQLPELSLQIQQSQSVSGNRGLVPLTDNNPFGVQNSTQWFDADMDDVVAFTVAPQADYSIVNGNFGAIGLGAAGGVGGGGGLGGGVMIDAEAAGVVAGQGWSQSGGLSLPIQLPVDGEPLIFSKAGGDAKVALRLRSTQSRQQTFSWSWCILCVLAAIGMALMIRQPLWRSRLQHHLPLALAILSAVAIFFVAEPWQPCAWISFLAMAAWTAWSNRQSAVA